MKLFLLGMAIFASIQLGSAEDPRVTVKEGILVGKTVTFSEDTYINKTRDIDVFLGVPFADPPVRFAPPESPSSWNGERNATEFSPACQQTSSISFPSMSEDCLYLNVYTPSPKPTGVPVMVWIHGGAFSVGSAMVYDYYGVPLVAVGDVIIVTINYRLAVFAQFSTKDEEAAGNFGMLDQVAALKWVYENIAAFGGDRDKITIFGESAGSASVSFHLISKLSRGYFSQAILESGTAFSGWAFKDDPAREQDISRNLGLNMGCDVSSSAALVSCLRTKEAEELFVAADEIYQLAGGYPVTLDGTFLHDTPENVYKMNEFAHVPIIVGFNKDEGTLYPYIILPSYADSPTPPPVNRMYFDALTNIFLTAYGKDEDIVHDAAIQEYADWKIADDPDADFFRSSVELFGDYDFSCPSDVVLRAHAESGDSVYEYFMTHEPTKSVFQYGDIIPSTPWLGAGHAEELTFVWGLPFIDELYNIKCHNMTNEENALSVKVMEFWTNFAKSGDPSKSSPDATPGEGLDYWPQYTIPELSHKELSPEFRVGRALKARQCHFWNEYIPNLVDFARGIGDEQEWRESYDDWKVQTAEWQQVFEDYKQQPTCN